MQEYLSGLTAEQKAQLDILKESNKKVARIFNVGTKIQKQELEDMGKPKRPLSSYILFVKECQKGDSGLSAVSRCS